MNAPPKDYHGRICKRMITARAIVAYGKQYDVLYVVKNDPNGWRVELCK